MTLKKNFEQDDKDAVYNKWFHGLRSSNTERPERCLTCAGLGFIYVNYGEVDCPDCNGEGVVYKQGRCKV